jgi:hypothetical protein
MRRFWEISQFPVAEETPGRAHLGCLSAPMTTLSAPLRSRRRILNGLVSRVGLSPLGDPELYGRRSAALGIVALYWSRQ